MTNTRKPLKSDADLKSLYRSIKINGKKIDLHRYIMEQHLGRPLATNEIVHHKDGNKHNNNLSNLEVMKRSEHSKKHKSGIKITNPVTLAKMSSHCKDVWASGAMDYRKKPVCSYDVVTGKLIKYYESQSATKIDGYDPKTISKCCTGKLKTAYGMVWKISQEAVPELVNGSSC